MQPVNSNYSTALSYSIELTVLPKDLLNKKEQNQHFPPPIEHKFCQFLMISGYPTSFGLFYPVGYLVVGFKNKESALQVQQDLKTGGYEDNDCTFFRVKK